MILSFHLYKSASTYTGCHVTAAAEVSIDHTYIRTKGSSFIISYTLAKATWLCFPEWKKDIPKQNRLHHFWSFAIFFGWNDLGTPIFPLSGKAFWDIIHFSHHYKMGRFGVGQGRIGAKDFFKFLGCNWLIMLLLVAKEIFLGHFNDVW